MYIYACIYISFYALINHRTHTYDHNMNSPMCVCMRAVCVVFCKFVYFMYVYIYTYIYIYIYILCMYAFLYVDVYVYVSDVCIKKKKIGVHSTTLTCHAYCQADVMHA
jgi:hypothetical protein